MCVCLAADPLPRVQGREAWLGVRTRESWSQLCLGLACAVTSSKSYSLSGPQLHLLTNGFKSAVLPPGTHKGAEVGD